MGVLKGEARGVSRREVRRRDTPVQRMWLSREQMARVIAKAHEEIGFAFSMQAMFMMRYDTLQHVRCGDITLKRDRDNAVVAVDVLVRREKAPSDVGPRMIRDMPVDVARVRPSSGLWTPVMEKLVARVCAGQTEDPIIHPVWVGDKSAYERYLKGVKAIITVWAGTEESVRTHDARRTGAYLHLGEGWPMKLIALVGGWSLLDHSALLRYLGKGIDVLTWANGNLTQ